MGTLGKEVDMRNFLKAIFLLVLTHSSMAEKPNILFLCIDDLRPELHCYGVEHIKSPNIDRLAERGRLFSRHYVNAPSCGPSRFTLLTGRYGPASNSALFMRAKKLETAPDAFPPSMPEWFRSKGYTTVSVGKVSHHPGGWGGKDWGDTSLIEVPGAWDRQLMPVGEWEHPRGAMHGLANGEIRVKASEMDVCQHVKGDDSIYPDGLITEEGLRQLDLLAADKDKPFFLAVGLLKPHLPFGAPEKYYDLYRDTELPPIPHQEKPEGVSTWHGSGEFMAYNRWGKDPRKDDELATRLRKHYSACVSYADASMGRIMARLRKLGLDGNTIVVLWGDHGWHLGEHAIWGKHALYEESLHSPLIVYYPGITQPGKKSDAVVETLDIFPTLCSLTKVPQPDFAQGQSLVPIIEKPETAGHAVMGYWGGSQTLRNDRYRFILHKKGQVELYDHENDPGELTNIAKAQPKLVAKYKAELKKRLN